MPDERRRFRVALSFAGEKREFVAQVALLLARRFGEAAILYDKYHEAEFARFDLGIRLPRMYGEQSDLVVPVLCPDYDRKRWTGWEWVQIYGLLTQQDAHRVMPCRFGLAEVDGLGHAAAFVELDDKTPEQLATLVLERLAINEGLPKDHYTRGNTGSAQRTPARVPNNLPRPQPFFGRTKELGQIADALAPDSRGWGVLIDGPGGMGKTALAVRAAELVPPGRFRRIVFLSAKERELTADGQRALGHFVLPGYLEMLSAIARELDLRDFGKLAEEERSDAILRALRGTEVLLLLDNLETLPAPDRDQLFALLNRLPQGCSAIVTSRRRADASAVAIRLDKLDWPAASELLDDLAQRNTRLAATTAGERHALYEDTGGNPLLMRWVSGQLGLGRCKTMTAALAFLRTAPAGNNPLEFVFGDLLDTFTVNETKVLAALTHFTAPVATAFIAELADINAAAAEGALVDLASRSLVLSDLEERQFSLVPLVADFLRRRRPEAVAETASRLEAKAYAAIVENGNRHYERFAVLDAAWPWVAAALPIFMAGANQRLQTICVSLSEFLDFSARWDEQLALNESAETRAVAAGDPLDAGWRAYSAGWTHLLRGHVDAALDAVQRAEAHWNEAKAGAHERATVIRLRGLALEQRENYAEALAAYTDAMALWVGIAAESEDVATILNTMGGCRVLAGDLDQAERDFKEALRIATAAGSRRGVAMYSGNLSSVAWQRGDWPKVEAIARESLVLSEALGSQDLIATNNWRIAHALLRQGKRDDALPHVQLAIEIFTRTGSRELAKARATLRECEA